MPKPSASGKGKTADCQTTAANANTSAGSRDETPAESVEPSGKTYAMCKELCQKISTAILRGINERFDEFETKFQTLVTSLADLKPTWATKC